MSSKNDIIKVARRFFREEPVCFPAASDRVEWVGSTEDLLKFSEAIFRVAYEEGHKDGAKEEASYHIHDQSALLTFLNSDD